MIQTAPASIWRTYTGTSPGQRYSTALTGLRLVSGVSPPKNGSTLPPQPATARDSRMVAQAARALAAWRIIPLSSQK